MSDGDHTEELFELECPHCHRTFKAELLSPRSPRQAGFKCPHCRLFVAYERTGDSNARR